MICIDMGQVPNIESMDELPKVLDFIKEHTPVGLRDNKDFIGNCLYIYATSFCLDATVELPLRIAFQEYLFDNYRVNGILDTRFTFDGTPTRMD